MATQPDEIFEVVRECLADSLALEPAKITRESRLADDLGADSLDIIDVVFMLEKRFQIRVRDTELSFLARLDFSSPEVLQGGFLTPQVLSRLRPFLPAIDQQPDPERIAPRKLFSLITVDSICRVIERQVGGASTP